MTEKQRDIFLDTIAGVLLSIAILVLLIVI